MTKTLAVFTSFNTALTLFGNGYESVYVYTET